MIFVKICGLTCLEDARCAVEAGADLLGFILYPKSPRHIPPAQIAPITAALRELAPEVVTVGVFVNETPQAMARALDEAGLDLAQLSGDEPLDHLRALQGRAYKAVREAAHAEAWLSAGRSPDDRDQESGVRRQETEYAIRITQHIQATEPATRSPQSKIQNPKSKIDSRPELLLDANHPTLYGGSGMRADESLAAALSRQCRLLLAGGLTPDNVADAIRVARPWGVDVSSGVERAPGRKDHAKVRAFIAAAKGVQS